MKLRSHLFAGWLALNGLASAQTGPLVELNKLPFFAGREYFTLRSGRAQMVVQADRADLGPAFTFLLFDAENPTQSAAKDRAFNFVPDEGFCSSALVVELGGYPFTAAGQTTDTGWDVESGIPCAKAVWWAGGIRVTERFSALGINGLFRRRITLDGSHLAGPEAVKLRLFLPKPLQAHALSAMSVSERQSVTWLVAECRGATLGLAVPGTTPARAVPGQNAVELGLVTVPEGALSIDTFLLAQMPGSEPINQEPSALTNCADSQELRATRRHWEETSSLSTTDRTVQDIFDHARFNLPGMVADNGIMDAGIFEYGAQWVRDSSNVALGALHAGEFELARGVLTHILTKMLSAQGATMIAGIFQNPGLEQFDQMGELLHCLREYRDWTGDDSLIRRHRDLLLALVERPLQPGFRDATGMVHNRSEFWERSFDDAYELAYQTYVILGLREAIQLAPELGAEDRVPRWRQEADRLQQAMLADPKYCLVWNGALIKRRNVSGEIAKTAPTGYKGFQPDVPLNTENGRALFPDASEALPIALGILPARSELARRTLDDLESLWNSRWSSGGYDRYNTSSQPDQPGPWPFATCFILRAQHDAGLFERSRRSLEWLNAVQGGRTGAWFEEIPSVRSQARACGLVPWTSAEVALFVVRHYLGVRFENGTAVIRPALYPGSPPVRADLRFRGGRLLLLIDGSGEVKGAAIDGKGARPDKNGAVRLPAGCQGATVRIHAEGHE